MRPRTKIALASLLMLLVAMTAFALWAEHWLRDFYLETVRQRMEDQLRALAPLVEPDAADLDARIDQAGTRLSSRITMMDASGRVLADSAFSGEALAALENHINREEVQEALRDGIGWSTRYSTSLDEHLLYVALRLPEERGVLRVATTLQGLEQRLAEMRWALGGRALLLIALFAPLGWWLTRRWTRSVEVLEAAVRELARGRLDTPIQLSDRDELSGVAASVRAMAAEQKGSLARLQTERGRLDTILGSLREGVLVTASDGRIQYANPAFSQIFGLDADPVGKVPLELVRLPELQQGIEEVLRGGEAAGREIEVGNQSLGVVFSPVEPAGNRGVVAVFHDLTELRRLEQVRRDFVTNLSHELRTPLTSIRGYAETLQQQPENLTAEQQRFLEKIARNSAQLAEIIQALLDLSRIERGQLSLRRETVTLADLREELERAFLERARSKGLEWNFQSPGLTAFSAARPLLVRALHNLLENALAHTERGSIGVLVEPRNGAVRFAVSDTGSGIPEVDQGRVFERFYRASGDLGRMQGSGVGLSIVKHIVALHGGRVWLESELGEGTRVFFELPQPGPPVPAGEES